MVDFEAVGQVVNASTPFVSVRDHDDLMTSIDELHRQLVDMAFDSSWLRIEEVADHGNVVRHNDEN